MNLGSLVTIARAKPANLLHFVYDNGAYDTTGGQPTPGADLADFRAIALGAGYPAASTFDDLEELQDGLPAVLAGPRPALVVLRVASLGRRDGVSGMRRMSEAFGEIKAYLATH